MSQEEGSQEINNSEALIKPFDFSMSNPEIQRVLSYSTFWSIASGIGGVTTAYIEGQTLFFPMYFFSGLGFCYSSALFGSSLAIKHFRNNQEDVYNYVGGGALGFSAVGTLLHGIRRGAKSAVVGAGLGAAFFYGGNWLYDKTRENYLEFRRHIVHRTDKKIFSKPLYDKRYTLQIGKRDERLPPVPLDPYQNAEVLKELDEMAKKGRSP